METYNIIDLQQCLAWHELAHYNVQTEQIKLYIYNHVLFNTIAAFHGHVTPIIMMIR